MPCRTCSYRHMLAVDLIIDAYIYSLTSLCYVYIRHSCAVRARMYQIWGRYFNFSRLFLRIIPLPSFGERVFLFFGRWAIPPSVTKVPSIIIIITMMMLETSRVGQSKLSRFAHWVMIVVIFLLFLCVLAKHSKNGCVPCGLVWSMTLTCWRVRARLILLCKEE